jgi:anti-sigma factor RsiW
VHESGALGHVTESDLAGYLDHDLAPADRLRVEAHLDACAQCRLELIEVQRLAASYQAATRRTARRWIPVAALTALAASVAALLLIPRIRETTTQRVEPVRSAGREGQLQIEVASPASDVAVAAATVVFTWRAARADVYRLTLLTESGEPVWSLETADTTALVPSGTRLKPGAYFWRVDAIADGITATSGARRLLVTR